MKKIIKRRWFPKLLLIAITVVLVFSLMPGLLAAGKWVGIFEGNGTTYHSGAPEVDIGWNFKMDNDNYIYGRMNFVEKITPGQNNHYIFNIQKNPVNAGNPASGPIRFNLDTDEIRVEGLGLWLKPGQENEVVYLEIHIRGPENTTAPDTIYYRVWDESKTTTYVDTGRVPISY